MIFALTRDPIDPRAVEASVLDPSCGAVLTFLGTARDNFEGRRVLRLEYEAWEEAALGALRGIGEEGMGRWRGSRYAIVHRLGPVPLLEPTVVIATAAPHREMCYAASRFALEALKARVPIWKREVYVDGSAWKANVGP